MLTLPFYLLGPFLSATIAIAKPLPTRRPVLPLEVSHTEHIQPSPHHTVQVLSYGATPAATHQHMTMTDHHFLKVEPASGATGLLHGHGIPARNADGSRKRAGGGNTHILVDQGLFHSQEELGKRENGRWVDRVHVWERGEGDRLDLKRSEDGGVGDRGKENGAVGSKRRGMPLP